MTRQLQESVFISRGKPASCRLGQAKCSRSPFAKGVFIIFGIRICYSQGSATILVAPAGMLPAGSSCARISSTEA